MKTEKQPARQCAVLVEGFVPFAGIACEALVVVEDVVCNFGCAFETVGIFVSVLVVREKPGKDEWECFLCTRVQLFHICGFGGIFSLCYGESNIVLDG